jgi:hypothetical protein
MPANRQNNPNFFGNVNLFSNVTGTPSFADQVKTTKQSQATPADNFGVIAPDTWEDAPKNAPTQAGVGAARDDGTTPTGPTRQLAVSTSAASLDQFVSTQPNQLDQYASYTYSISWYVLSPTQYNNAIQTQVANVAGWQLLMQSAGAPVKGRSPAFPVDYYMDDLEIESVIPFGGNPGANSANKIRFKVTEPNGITLIQSLYNAVKLVYKNSQQLSTSASASGTPNYLEAQYCLIIQFYGYDSNGNLVAPAKGSDSGYGQKAVIVKYYPFRLLDIKFSIANRAIEYQISGVAIPYSYAGSTDRGTVPFSFNMTGQTVDQLLNGSPAASSAGTNTADPGARPTPKRAPPNPTVSVNDIRASAGVNVNGNFTGETESPFSVVAP